jgi:hypothetical protein
LQAPFPQLAALQLPEQLDESTWQTHLVFVPSGTHLWSEAQFVPHAPQFNWPSTPEQHDSPYSQQDPMRLQETHF